MKVYVVCEDYTCAFLCAFADEEKAQTYADHNHGYVIDVEVE